ncbi:MAG: acyltransferase [Solirubrobacteraceae bacterium]
MSQSRPAPTGASSSRVGRLHELDALRGVAAVSVVLNHSAIAFPVMHDDTSAAGLTLANVLKYTPLSALFAGFPAVIIFFVLSGLVLALPFVSGRGDGYRAFIVKRVLRLWPPYAVAVGVTFLLVATIGATDVNGMSEWFYEKWDDPLTAAVIAGHASLIGSFDHNPFNPAVWSLVYEMRISLIFPALVLTTVLLGWKRGLALALALSFIAVLARSDSAFGSYLSTLKYIPCFVAGILLAVHWQTLSARMQRLSARAAMALAAIALLAYSWPAWANEDWFPGPLAALARNRVSDLVLLTLGASLIILLVQRPGRARSALLSRVPQYLGRISYSLYLVHVPVLLAVLHLLGAAVEPLLLLPLAWLLSIVCGDVLQRLVERPSHSLGRRLARHPAISRPEKAVKPVLPRPSEPSPALRGPG